MKVARAIRFARKHRRAHRVLRAALGTALLPWMALVGLAMATPLPPALAHRAPPDAAGAREMSLRIEDRNGLLLRDMRAAGGKRARRMRLAEFGPDLVRAMLAAEDHRFYSHAGVDPLAIGRAFAESIAARRVVSGASTLTQQLGRNVAGEPRTLRGKIAVMALALRIEASLDKDAILEEYLNRIEFGPAIEGAEAASEHYFGKPAKELSLAEAAALASIPRGPTLYDPSKGSARLLKRRNRVLDRMADVGLATSEEAARAKNEPLVLAPAASARDAPQFVKALLEGTVDPCAPGEAVPSDVVDVKTTIDAGLQAEISGLAKATVRGLGDEAVSAASVIVIENATGNVLAYVGSPDPADKQRLGANDGVRALRQPGSSLKPFLYELAMEDMSFSPATLLPDVDLAFPAAEGAEFRPHDYDGRFHGPVLLRDALGNSFNVPAVWTLERAGVPRFVDRLKSLGICSLTETPSYYGLALALGDAEVRLVDLANAYATLARRGMKRPLRAVESMTRWNGESVTPPETAPARVLDERDAYLITDVLSDRSARLASFGEGSVLELPFEVAAKTGTSKGYRDNIAAGYTPEFTVAVWVGNFDGSPMKNVSGITGAGPLFRGAMLATAKRIPPTPFQEPDGIAEVDVCPLSGKLRGHDCPHAKHEKVVKDRPIRERCDMHTRALVERATGELAGPRCADALVEERTFEWYPARFLDWARAAGRPLMPTRASERCPGAHPPHRSDSARIVFPEDGARFFIDPGASAPNAIRIRAAVPQGAHARLTIDGVERDYPDGGVEWRLVPGDHAVKISVDGESDTAGFTVE